MLVERKTGGRKKIKPSIEEFDAFYREHDAKETAEHYGVSRSTIYKWATEYRKEQEDGTV